MNESFLRLLDYSDCKSKEEVLKHSSIVASELINNWKIVTTRGERRFLGVEFYIFIPGMFEDDTTHCRDEQLDSGTFYFHTRSKDTNWSPPIFNRHGVDISCGNRMHGIYGGILLRHLSGECNKDGSGLALRSLIRGDEGFKKIERGSHLAKWSKGEIEFFENTRGKKIFGNKVYLEYEPLNQKVKPDALPRKGLDKNKKYANELLRFVHPNT